MKRMIAALGLFLLFLPCYGQDLQSSQKNEVVTDSRIPESRQENKLAGQKRVSDTKKRSPSANRYMLTKARRPAGVRVRMRRPVVISR